MNEEEREQGPVASANKTHYDSLTPTHVPLGASISASNFKRYIVSILPIIIEPEPAQRALLCAPGSCGWDADVEVPVVGS